MLSKEQLQRLKALTAEEQHSLSERLRSEKIPVFQVVAQALRQCGIQRVSGITGAPIDELFPALHKAGLQLIGSRHQNAATLAAAADNYLSGALRHAVVVSAGPAVTNAVTGIHVAMQNHWPLLVIGGRRPVTDQGCGYFQEFDAVPMMASITKWTTTIRGADGLAELVREACQRAIDGKPGPVYLDLPEDVAAMKSYAPQLDAVVRDPGRPPGQEDAEECLRHLRKARKPLVCLGEGLRWNGNPPAIREFLEREGVPFITTPLGRGIVPDAHPLCLNRARRKMLTQADVVLMAGAWFDWRLRFGSALDPQARVIHVHPDADELGRNVESVQTVLCDPGLFLDALGSAASEDAGRAPAHWWPAPETSDETAAPRPTAALHPREMCEALRPLIPAEAITVIEASFALSHGQFVLATAKPFSWLDPGWNGCIGSGVPFAIGAKLSHPDRPVVAIVGDTGFGMHGAELETAVRYHIPVVVLIANNSGINGRVRQRNLFGDEDAPPFCLFGPELAYHDMASALGVHSVLVRTAAELRDAFRAALDSGRPNCINVILDPTATSPGIW
jgi:2-hydroxyacyl-CoA lyase